MYAFICVLCDKWTQSWNGYCLYDCVINTCINLCLALLCTYLFAVVVTVLHPHTVRTVLVFVVHRSINETCTINVIGCSCVLSVRFGVSLLFVLKKLCSE